MLTPQQTVLASALLGRDISGEVAMLSDVRSAVGRALPVDMQIFVSSHWRGLSDFLSSEEGKVAAQTFVSDWAACIGKALPAQKQG